MKLKTYQLSAIDVLERFLKKCRIIGVSAAYEAITNDSEIAERLGKMRNKYVNWNSIEDIPRVCIKIPTGGGKTIVAAHAIRVVANTWCEREYPVVLWFCPSETIRRQTSEALKNPRHPYRMVLNEQFSGSAIIFDIEDKFHVKPADMESAACIIVSTIQAFRQRQTDKYNVYKDSEYLEPHFIRSKTNAHDGMEKKECGSRVKYSFANLLFQHRPIVIVDEAHNVISDLSQELLGRINPSAIVELTATPRLNNNTVYNVRASELKKEEMIKLPIELREHLGWEHAIDEAITKRAELEEVAKGESEYLRPILLFQAQDRSNEVNVTVDVLHSHLVETLGLPPHEIATVTGEQKELDGIDIFDRSCPIKYIITVEALKEGWDCSFAYVLCSLANVQSNTAVEQLLGRVMRMPYAKNRKAAALNKAYAYVLSKSFGDAASSLVRKLGNKGFDETEAAASIELKQSELWDLLSRTEINKVDLAHPLETNAIPASIMIENEGQTIVFTQETTDADVAVLVEKVSSDKAFEIQSKFSSFKRQESKPSPAMSGSSFSIPQLMMHLQNEFVLADPDVIFEEFDWDISEYAEATLKPHEFKVEPVGSGFVIELDGNRLSYSLMSKQTSLPFVEVEGWTSINLILWLDRKLRQEDIPQPKMINWLRQVIQYLTDDRAMSLSTLMATRYALANKINAKIKTARNLARTKAFQTSFFMRDARVMLDFDSKFVFDESMYDGEVMYGGSYRFQKHYLGASKVPVFSGGDIGEEFACAQALDAIPSIKYWLRNISRHKRSFWLPTSSDKFYPDFVAVLEDDRILVVEYKGGHLADNQDTKEKRMIGEFWEKQSSGQCLFIVVEKTKDNLTVTDQINMKITTRNP